MDCAQIISSSLVCAEDGQYIWKTQIQNNFGGNLVFDRIRLYDPNTNALLASENIVIEPNETSPLLTFELSPWPPIDTFCFRLYFYAQDAICCHIEVCLPTPECCATITNEDVTCNEQGK